MLSELFDSGRHKTLSLVSRFSRKILVEMRSPASTAALGEAPTPSVQVAVL